MLHLLFSFRGRINRADVWKFVLVVGGLNFVASVASRFIEDGVPILLPQFVLLLGWDQAVQIFQSATFVQRAVIAADFLAYLIFLFAWLAVASKRLHDRDKSAWWLVPFILVPFACQVTAIQILPWAGNAAIPLLIIATAFGMWGAAELMFLKGTEGNNRYGPDTVSGPVVNPISTLHNS